MKKTISFASAALVVFAANQPVWACQPVKARITEQKVGGDPIPCLAPSVQLEEGGWLTPLYFQEGVTRCDVNVVLRKVNDTEGPPFLGVSQTGAIFDLTTMTLLDPEASHRGILSSSKGLSLTGYTAKDTEEGVFTSQVQWRSTLSEAEDPSQRFVTDEQAQWRTFSITTTWELEPWMREPCGMTSYDTNTQTPTNNSTSTATQNNRPSTETNATSTTSVGSSTAGTNTSRQNNAQEDPENGGCASGSGGPLESAWLLLIGALFGCGGGRRWHRRKRMT